MLHDESCDNVGSVLIVAKCIVNLGTYDNKALRDKVLIVAKCIVNTNFSKYT